MDHDKSQPPPDYMSAAPAAAQYSQPGPQQASYPPQQAGHQPQQAGYQPQQAGFAAQPAPGYANPAYPAYASGTTGVVQQPHTVIVTQGGPSMYIGEQRPDPVGQYILSCCVIWCCCICLGIPGFILTVMSASDNNVEGAKSKLRVASILNITGLVIGICLHLIWVALIIASIAANS